MAKEKDNAKELLALGRVPVEGFIVADSLRPADEAEPDGDKMFTTKFSFSETVLFGLFGVHLFPKEELKKAVGTGVGKPVNTDHNLVALSQFGQLAADRWIEETDNSHIEVDVRLFTSAHDTKGNLLFPDAMRAYHLLKTSTVKNVSAEILWQKSECSICGHTYERSAPNPCSHIAKQMGTRVKGKLVYEILSGLTIAGMAITRLPADKRAEVISVACEGTEENEPEQGGDDEMSLKANEAEKKKTEAAAAAAAQAAQDSAPEGAVAAAAEAAAAEAEKGKEAAAAEGDAGGGTETTTTTATETQTTTDAEANLSPEQLKALATELNAKLDMAEKELKAARDQIYTLNEQIYELKGEIRRGEIKTVIDAMKRAGKELTEKEEYDLQYTYREMSEAEFAGVKAGILTMTSGLKAPLAAASAAGEKPATGSAAAGLAAASLKGAFPVAVPDSLISGEDSNDIHGDAKNAFAPVS
jgi:hypothetical protein